MPRLGIEEMPGISPEGENHKSNIFRDYYKPVIYINQPLWNITSLQYGSLYFLVNIYVIYYIFYQCIFLVCIYIRNQV